MLVIVGWDSGLILVVGMEGGAAVVDMVGLLKVMVWPWVAVMVV